LKKGESYAGRILLDGNPVFVPDITKADLWINHPFLEAEKFTSYFGMPLVAKDHVIGVLEIYHRSTLNPNHEWINNLESLSTQTAIAIDSITLFRNLERSNIELAQAYETTLEGWSRAMDLRDKETEGHTQRVTEMTVQLARNMSMSEDEIVHIWRGALLHDMGKLGVPDAILLKPGKLTDEEWVIMKQHPQFAYNMLSPITYLHPALDIPYCHHEKWDGTGYPRGLKGQSIPVAAQIFAVVDVWDALISDRPYRAGWTKEKVLDFIREQSGKHFNPEIVDMFLKFELLDEHIDVLQDNANNPY
jgi:HD-GYP domain-containing protein (c-di-GMP phosphodiesterase class II)